MNVFASAILALLILAQPVEMDYHQPEFHKPSVEVDYYQPAFREPLELFALAKPLLTEQVKISADQKANRLKIESESKGELAKAVKLLQFIDRNALEFNVEIALDYMERLEKLGYSCELSPIFSGVYSGVLKKEETDAKTFTTSSEKRQQFTVIEKQSADVYTGRTQMTPKTKEVYVHEGKPVVSMEAVEKFCGFHLSCELTPTGLRLIIDPYCSFIAGTDQKFEFSGPKFSVPVELKKPTALFIPDDPHYPQAQRIASALLIWAGERLERRPVLVFKAEIKGLDEITKESKK